MKVGWTPLEDVSIDFGSFDMSNNSNSLQELDSYNGDLSMSEKDVSSTIDSVELSLSESNDNSSNLETNQAKKQLLLKILAFPASNRKNPITAPQNHSDFQFEFDNDENAVPITTALDSFKVLTTDAVSMNANYNRTDKDLPFRSGDNDKLNSEIARLTDMLGDRRTQFRDLVRN